MSLTHFYEQVMVAETRYGRFIHYGLYSLLERGEWVWNREEISLAKCKALAARFTAKDFDTDHRCLIGSPCIRVKLREPRCAAVSRLARNDRARAAPLLPAVQLPPSPRL